MDEEKMHFNEMSEAIKIHQLPVDHSVSVKEYQFL
jgi:hypothetical protein